MEGIVRTFARELDKREEHVKNVIALIDERSTIPFIARYRKELHGAMDDTALRALADWLSYLRNLETRREEIRKAKPLRPWKNVFTNTGSSISPFVPPSPLSAGCRTRWRSL